MNNIWFISDTHFGHKNILEFKKSNGSPLRDFASTHDMDMTMVENWNRVVKPADKVYHLGDVAFTDGGLKLLGLCNGKKRLVRGNHDQFKIRRYLEHFEEIYGVRQIDGYWMTHVPMHADSVASRRVKGNIHGHLHANEVMKEIAIYLPEVGLIPKMVPDEKYFNVSVERINFTPINFDEIKGKLNV